MQESRPNGDALPADLLFGFTPITDGIALSPRLPALEKNLVRPMADLCVRTDADAHRFLLRFWLSGGIPAASRARQRPFPKRYARQGFLRATARIFYAGMGF